MSDPHGDPNWYELTSANPLVARRFYEELMGWTIQPEPVGEMPYRVMFTPDGQSVGGLWSGMPDGPLKLAPGWRVYFGVDDVATVVEIARTAGGEILMPMVEFLDIGQLAYLADHQGDRFYLWRTLSGTESQAFRRQCPGHGAWHRLQTSNAPGACHFYGQVFGWRYGAGGGDGRGSEAIILNGAAMGDIAPVTTAPGWLPYFRVPDLNLAARKVADGGGTVHGAPEPIGEGELAIVASDPEGVRFALIADG